LSPESWSGRSQCEVSCDDVDSAATHHQHHDPEVKEEAHFKNMRGTAMQRQNIQAQT
jgi:hypothetical protein